MILYHWAFNDSFDCRGTLRLDRNWLVKLRILFRARLMLIATSLQSTSRHSSPDFGKKHGQANSLFWLARLYLRSEDYHRNIA